MHSSTQLIAQRAPPATRTKARWQPYSIIPSSSTLPFRSPMAPYLNTPIPSVPSSPPIANSSCDSTRIRPLQLSTTAQPPKDSSQRDMSKQRFAIGLIDQAVTTISDIWRPQDVPRVFLAPTKGTSLINVTAPNSNPSSQQMPGIKTKPFSSPTPPSTPSTKPSPFPPPSIPPTSKPSSSPVDPLMPSGDAENLLPMKTFVHEVLRRSRTSGNILQAALCYLEAIRSKVPEILQQERMGIRAHYQPDTLIQAATDAELVREAELAVLEESSVRADPDDLLKTVVSKDCDADFDAQDNFETNSASSHCSLEVQPSESLASPSSSLPSPLLCPRRAFLASLILASKFFQDKCYSNRAWAKLSGLPPREIGRCERALGQALEWRLWVGKTSPSAPTLRTLARAQSESSLSNSQRASDTHETSLQPLRRCASLPEEILSGTFCHKGLEANKTSRNFIFSTPTPVTHAQTCDANMEDQNTDQLHAHLMESQFSDESDSSPSPETPPLTYSPSSTSCSSGDRTIQMSTIEDCMFPNASGSQAWPDYPESRGTPISSFGTGADLRYRPIHCFSVEMTSKRLKPAPVTIVDSELGPFGGWPVDGQYVSFETTTTH